MIHLLTPAQELSVMSKIGSEDADGCWPWIGALTSGGYGSVGLGGSVVQAHRVVYRLLVGPIPDGLQLDHLCRVRNCVNPDHLEPVTPQENMLRAKAATRRTHCKRGHEYTPENTYRADDGWRACRACYRSRRQERKEAEVRA